MASDFFVREIPPEIHASITIRAHTDSLDAVKLLEKSSSPVIISGSHDKSIKVWDFHTQQHISTLLGHTEAVFSLDFNESGQLASCSPDQSVRIWDLKSSKEVSRGLGHTYKVYYVLYTSPTHLVSCGRDHKILMWDTRKMNAPVKRFGDDSCGTFRSIAKHENLLLASTAESGIEGYDYESGRSLFREALPYDLSVFPEDTLWVSPPTIVYCVKFFRNGEFLTAHQDMAIRKYRFQGGLSLEYLRRGHFDGVRYIEIANDNSLFVTTCQDGSVRLWQNDLPTANLVGHSQIVSSACLTSDNSKVITSSYDQSIKIFDISHR